MLVVRVGFLRAVMTSKPNPSSLHVYIHTHLLHHLHTPLSLLFWKRKHGVLNFITVVCDRKLDFSNGRLIWSGKKC